MTNIIEAKIRLGCELAEPLYSQGQIVQYNFREECPFGKDKVDKICIHCKHCQEEVIKDE